MASSRRIWVYHNKVWSKGSVIAGTSPQHAKKVLIDGHAKPVSLTKKPTMAVKHNDRRKTKERAEVLPTKAVGPRPERFRPPEIVIEAVAFTRPGTIGDYGWQLQPEQYHEYGRALHVYNENMQQQNNKDSTLAGGGNAIARPFRQYGRSVGMPTGHYGGFQSLDELCLGHNFNCTAKEGIDLATEEIVMQVCDNPGRYDKIYYCKNANDDEELIGMQGIYHLQHLKIRRGVTSPPSSRPCHPRSGSAHSIVVGRPAFR